MTLQKRVKSMIEKNTSLAYMIQVMLFRRILPCQRRSLHMWEFNPAGPRTLERFFGTRHEEIWKLLFKAQKSWPETTNDIGLDFAHSGSPVSILISEHNLVCNSKGHAENSIL